MNADTSNAVPSQSSVVLSDQAAALLDHLTSAINDDVELPTVLRNEGGLRREAAELYLAVDRFHRKLKRLAGDEDDDLGDTALQPERYVCQPDRMGFSDDAELLATGVG